MDLVTTDHLPLSPGKIDDLYEELLEREFRNVPLGEIFAGLISESKGLNRIEMSNRARNVLWRHNINSLRDLGGYSISDINDFRNSGSGTMFELVSLYLQNLRAITPENLMEASVKNEPSSHEHWNEQIDELGFLPPQVVRFLNQIAGDLKVRDLHVINARSKIGDLLTHGTVAEDWGISRQRIHQIENHLVQRFRNEPLLIEISDLALPAGSIRGLSELVSSCPWLNLGVAIHPIGVSILQILIFSELIVIDQGWILSNQKRDFQTIKAEISGSEDFDFERFADSADISAEVLEYLRRDFKQSSATRHAVSDMGGESKLSIQNEADDLLDKLVQNIHKEQKR
jgi:hypothetical protein